MTRFTGADARALKSSNEKTEVVGVDGSGVHARELTDSEGEWQLEPHDEVKDTGRAPFTTDCSAAVMREVALSKCAWAW